MSVTSHGPEPCASAYSAISACSFLVNECHYSRKPLINQAKSHMKMNSFDFAFLFYSMPIDIVGIIVYYGKNISHLLC